MRSALDKVKVQILSNSLPFVIFIPAPNVQVVSVLFKNEWRHSYFELLSMFRHRGMDDYFGSCGGFFFFFGVCVVNLSDVLVWLMAWRCVVSGFIDAPSGSTCRHRKRAADRKLPPDPLRTSNQDPLAMPPTPRTP